MTSQDRCLVVYLQ